MSGAPVRVLHQRGQADVDAVCDQRGPRDLGRGRDDDDHERPGDLAAQRIAAATRAGAPNAAALAGSRPCRGRRALRPRLRAMLISSPPLVGSVFRSSRFRERQLACLLVLEARDHEAVVVVRSQQLRVRADRGDPAALEQRDPVGEHDRRRPVRDDERRGGGEHPPKRGLDESLGVDIERRQRVVEHQHLGLRRNRAREREPLPLATREAEPLLTDLRVESLRQVVDERCLRDLERLGEVSLAAPRADRAARCRAPRPRTASHPRTPSRCACAGRTGSGRGCRRRRAVIDPPVTS